MVKSVCRGEFPSSRRLRSPRTHWNMFGVDLKTAGGELVEELDRDEVVEENGDAEWEVEEEDEGKENRPETE